MPVLEFEVQDGIAVITINRPESRNAMNPEVTVRLIDAFAEVRDRDDIRVAILTGAGDRAFCSGGDLDETIPLMTGARNPETEWDKRWLEIRTTGAPFKTDVGKPMIAAINGDAIAGGMELVQNAELRFAVPNARFGVPEVQLGLFPGGASTVRLPRQFPYAIAMDLLLTGELMSAEVAHRYGFLNDVVELDQLMPRALAVAERIAANGPVAVKAVRDSARACSGVEEESAFLIEAGFASPILDTEDAVEGPRAFMEKRKPVFRGR
jgi:enoyl-CoA hydratase